MNTNQSPANHPATPIKRCASCGATQGRQHEALQTAIRLLRDSAQELAEGISVHGVPDWKGEPETAAAYDETIAAVVALEAHQAEHIALQHGYDAARLEIESLRAQLDAIGAVRTLPWRWYSVDKDGLATLCINREEAEKEAAEANEDWPSTGPHRAVRLVEASFDAADSKKRE